MLREYVNCKCSRGIGFDVWYGHNLKENGLYMSETDCSYFGWLEYD